MYGNIKDTDSYLNKFVDIQYTLPESDIKDFIITEMAGKYPVIKESLEKLQNKILYNNNGNWLIMRKGYADLENELYSLCKNFALSLRDIDKLCLKLSIVLPIIAKKDYEFSLTFLVVLILLNIKNNDVYKYFKNVNLLADNSNWAGKTYWSEPEFRNVYKKLYQRMNDKHSNIYNHPECTVAKNLLNYCEIIDFAEDFS